MGIINLQNPNGKWWSQVGKNRKEKTTTERRS